MRTSTITFFLLLFVSTAMAQTATQPSGTGTTGDPYQIADLSHLYWLSQSDTAWDRHYIQTTDIDASATENWDGGSGFSPVGNGSVPFSGTYNGQGNTINGIYIDQGSSNFKALFGKTGVGAHIDSLGLINVFVKGNRKIGGLVGANHGTVSCCYSTGDIRSDLDSRYVYGGGLVGLNKGGISESFSISDVHSPGHLVGGLVGRNTGDTIRNCYSQGTVKGDDHVGGLVGSNYLAGSVILNSYSTNSVEGDIIGGLLGYNYEGNVSNSFWDEQTSGCTLSGGGTGKSTSEMKQSSTFISAGWDFINNTTNGTKDYWGREDGSNHGYPFLNWYQQGSGIPFPAKDLVFAGADTTSITLQQYDSYGADGYAIYINDTDQWNAPADGTVPTADTVWNNSGQQCIYFGTSTQPGVRVTGLNHSTTYYFRVYSYNDSSGTPLFEPYGAGATMATDVPSLKPSGSGSQNDPYRIEQMRELTWLMSNDTAWDRHYVQVADLNAGETKNWYEGKGFQPIGNNATPFSGTYNGCGHTIDSLFINRVSQDNIGLFGITGTGALIDTLGIANADVTGRQSVGSLVGQNRGEATACYARGKVAGTLFDDNVFAGGLVGMNKGFLNTSYGEVEVNADGHIAGGLVGRNHGGTISNCYSRGDVSGKDHVGGLVGNNYQAAATIQDCYSTGSVSGNQYVGGLLGFDDGGSVTKSFWDTDSAGVAQSAGGSGKTSDKMMDPMTYVNAGWDYADETVNGTMDPWFYNESHNDGYPFLSWQGFGHTCMPFPARDIVFGGADSTSITLDSYTSYGSDGFVIYINDTTEWAQPANGSEPTADTIWNNNGQQCVYRGASHEPGVVVEGLQPATTYHFRVYSYNDCGGTPTYDTTGTDAQQATDVTMRKPAGKGSSSNPYQISRLEELAWLMSNDTAWHRHYVQTADLNAGKTKNWFEGKGFQPIGNTTTPFNGTYNGRSHAIDSLYINRKASENIGLFGLAGFSAEIDSVSITNSDVAGGRSVGLLVGQNRGVVTGCSSTGKVYGAFTDKYVYAGGLIGLHKGALMESFSLADVQSDGHLVGGLAGRNHAATIMNCYSRGDVSGKDHVGGLVGNNHQAAATIQDCYSTGSVSGNQYVGGLLGFDDGGSVQSSFWDTDSAGVAQSAGGSGKTSDKMMDPMTYVNAGWDYADETVNGTMDPWFYNESHNDGYPFLSWQGFGHTCMPFPARDIVFGGADSTSITLDSYTSYGSDGFVIYINDTTEWAQPANGSEPTADTIWNNNGQQCVYRGASHEPGVVVEGLQPATTYHFRVYSYNDCGGTPTYDTTGTDAQETTHVTMLKPAGDGSQNNPYQISRLEELAWLMGNDTAWDRHYIQTRDLDASPTNGWYDGKGFVPVGNGTTAFTGMYHGQGHAIDSLYIARGSESNIGLFGLTETTATIDSLGITHADVTGLRSVGALVGQSRGEVTACYAKGKVKGTNINQYVYAGGLVGLNKGLLRASYSDVNVDSDGHLAGGLAGRNHDGTISNCYSRGNVSGSEHVGGLVGNNYSSGATIENSYSTGKVSGQQEVGGLLGASEGGTVTNSFWDKEAAERDNSVGGSGMTTEQMTDPMTFLTSGWDYLEESTNGGNNYWGYHPSSNGGYPFLSWQPHQQTCHPFPVHGITFGEAKINSLKINSFTSYGPDGFAIYINDTSHWEAPAGGSQPAADTQWQEDGQQCIYFGNSSAPDVSVTGLKEATTYYFRVYSYNNCGGSITYDTTSVEVKDTTVMPMDKPSGHGTVNDPYQIEQMSHLSWLMVHDTAWDRHYVQTSDLNASSAATWYRGRGFVPIGNGPNKFTGTYNGRGHTVDSLYINRPSTGDIGLFGHTGTDAGIDSLGVVDARITGKKYVGALVGQNRGEINSCYATGEVRSNLADRHTIIGGLVGVNRGTLCESFAVVEVYSEGHLAGGLAGRNNEGTISNCYSRGNVTGQDHIGGLVGDNYLPAATIEQCYSTGRVNGSLDVGGLLGYNDGGTVSYSFWDTEFSGLSSSGGGRGKTPTEMWNANIYLDAGWDFADHTVNGNEDNWTTNSTDNNGYPFLSWQVYTYEDTVPPEPNKETLATVSDECSASVSEKPTATDHRGGEIVAQTNDPLEYTEVGSHTIEWFYDDGYGNISTQQQTVEVLDNTVPAISCVSNQTKNISSGESHYTVSADEFDPAQVSDNCGIDSVKNDFNEKPTLKGAEFEPGTTTVTWTVKDNGGNTDQCSFEVTVNQSTGLETLEKAGIELYPNPVKNRIHYEWPDKNIQGVRIADLTGRVLVEQTGLNDKGSLDLSGLSEGMYIFRITTGEKSYSVRIIKE